MAISAEKHQVTRQVFLWLMACMYLFAFASLYTQIPGLYGSNGLIPVHLVLPTQQNDNSSWTNRLLSFPSLLVFHDSLRLSPSLCMECMCVVGSMLALCMMAFRAMRCSLLFGILFLLYLSVYKVGQVFLWFQWDTLLLEAGFLTILVAPFNLMFWKKPAVSSHNGLTIWLVRWLLFRLMFASGVVKLQSQCPTWWGLTALNTHFESQCIPTPLAWYAHHLPDWLLRLSVVATYWIESVTPLLFFLPVRSLRIFAFLSQVFLQVLIIATGNYNFFNLLTITLSVSLADDWFFGNNTSNQPSFSSRLSQAVFGCYGNMVHQVVRFSTFISVLGVMLSLTVYYFNIQLDTDNWTVLSETGFSSESLDVAMATAVPFLALIGAASLAIEILNSFFSSVLQYGLLSKIWSLLQTLVFASVVMVMFSVSLLSYGVLDGSFYNSVPSQIKLTHDTLNQYSVTSQYGLFRRMTGVGGRPELIVEGSMDGEEWREFEFLYKPGSVDKSPVFVAPHQPRLDWQMWFASLGSYQNNPWLVHLAYRLLQGTPEVMQLMAPPPFTTPPQFVRARLFTYHFTQYNYHRPFYNQTSAWWDRSLKSDYLFSLSLDNQNLIEFLSKHSYLSKAEVSYPSTLLSTALSSMRAYSNLYYPPSILLALFFTGLVATLTMALIFPDHSPPSNRPARVTKGGAVQGGHQEVTMATGVRKRQTNKNKNN